MTTNWKNLTLNPPSQNCNVCIKSGTDFETFKFERHSEVGWSLYKFGREINRDNISPEALYINLDDIL